MTIDALFALARTIRAAATEIVEADPVSHDLLIGISTTVEKQHWLFRAQR